MVSQVVRTAGRTGLSAANFRKIAANGFGDAYNSYAHSMCWFREHLYVGTTRANLANRALQIGKLTPERLGDIWPVRVPKDYWDNNLAAEIWRYHPPTGRWTKVYTAPQQTGIDGFPVPISVGFRSMVVFQGASDPEPMLYVPTWGSHQTPTSFLLRSADGEHFEIASEPGSAVPEHRPRSIRGFLAYKGHLIGSPVVGQKRFEPNVAGHMVLVTCTDPVKGDWQPACVPGFGDPNNVSVFQMAVFNGYLYAATMNINEGFQIWKTDAATGPPFQWRKVLAGGAGRGRFNQVAMALCVHGDHLYIGSGIQNCSFDYDYNVGPAGPEILRLDADDRCELIMGEPRLSKMGLQVPLSGLGPGFDSPFAGYLWSLSTHDGWLYAGTGVWTVFLRYKTFNPTNVPTLSAMLQQIDLETLLKHRGGSELWRTRDGKHWLPVTKNGFDNCYNIGIRTQVSTPHGLFIGTANPFGPDVAIKRGAGWTYEPNPAGGLEVWLGNSHESHVRELREPYRIRAVASAPDLLSDGDQQTSEHTEQRLFDSLTEAFFRGSGFRHFGYWKTGCEDGLAACQNLVRELAAYLPDPLRPNVQATSQSADEPVRSLALIDLHAGNGATTAELLRVCPAAQLTAVADDRQSTVACRQQTPAATIIERTNFKSSAVAGSFDAAILLKGFGRLPVSRRRLFQDAYRVLRPGGQLLVFDALGPTHTRRWYLPAQGWGDDAIATVEQYKLGLSETGFGEAQVVDVTSQCLTSFKENLARFLVLRYLTGELTPISIEALVTYLTMDQPVSQCILVAAQKPGESTPAAVCRNSTIGGVHAPA